jgi:hypothetical protein
VTRTKHVLLGLYLLFSVGCAVSYGTAMPRVASGIEATKDLWKAFCQPVPVGKEKVCADSKDGVNTVVDFYTEVNDAL